MKHDCSTCPEIIDHLTSDEECPECGAQGTGVVWIERWKLDVGDFRSYITDTSGEFKELTFVGDPQKALAEHVVLALNHYNGESR